MGTGPETTETNDVAPELAFRPGSDGGAMAAKEGHRSSHDPSKTPDPSRAERSAGGGTRSDQALLWSASGPRDDAKQGERARDDARQKPLRDRGKRRKPLRRRNPWNDVSDGDVPLDVSVDDNDVVDADRIDHTAVEVTVSGREHDLFGAILRVEESVPQGLASPSRGTRRRLLGIEGVIQSVPEGAAKPDQIRMSKRIHSPYPHSY
jgi:hypothetical protein